MSSARTGTCRYGTFTVRDMVHPGPGETIRGNGNGNSVRECVRVSRISRSCWRKAKFVYLYKIVCCRAVFTGLMRIAASRPICDQSRCICLCCRVDHSRIVCHVDRIGLQCCQSGNRLRDNEAFYTPSGARRCMISILRHWLMSRWPATAHWTVHLIRATGIALGLSSPLLY